VRSPWKFSCKPQERSVCLDHDSTTNCLTMDSGQAWATLSGNIVYDRWQGDFFDFGWIFRSWACATRPTARVSHWLYIRGSALMPC
jgi:hypothetical protein